MSTASGLLNAVHLDLKGVLFKPGYIPQLLQDLADQRVNAVVVEYEDVFPFNGIEVAWDRQHVWSRKTLMHFLAAAKALGIEVIPLQQCLGHLEYVFRWNRYRQFAENHAYPGTLCLSQAKGRELLLDMLQQILAAHPDSRYIHLGMDEAHALATCSKCAARGDVLDTFLTWLRELIGVVEAAGKTPIIWSDMLEDHFCAKRLLGDLKQHVIVCPWDYHASGRRTNRSRLEGWRVAKAWLGTPEDPAAPAISPGQRFLEDLSPASARLLKPYRHGREVDSLFLVDMWTKLGFRVLGASGLRISGDMHVLPFYHRRFGNVQCWAKAIARTGQLGVIGTSWARGTTFCPPNFSIDLCWPVIAEQSRALGLRPKPFWPGVPAATVKRLVLTLGRCRQDWQLEVQVAEELEALAPQVRAHRHEWDSLALMARVLHLLRRAAFAMEEVRYFDADIRLVDSEWQRRLNEQQDLLKELRTWRRRVRQHFGRRYFGAHFQEWLRELFDLPERQLRDAGKECRRKLQAARRAYRSSRPKPGRE